MAKSARARDFFDESLRRQIKTQPPPARAHDRHGRELDADFVARAGERRKRRPTPVLRLPIDAAQNADEFFGRFLRDQLRGANEQNPLRRAAVQYRQFRAVDFDRQIIDSERGQRGQQMLDRRHARAPVAQTSGEAGVYDIAAVGAHFGRRRQIDAAKHHAGIGGCGQKTGVNRFAAVQPPSRESKPVPRWFVGKPAFNPRLYRPAATAAKPPPRARRLQSRLLAPRFRRDAGFRMREDLLPRQLVDLPPDDSARLERARRRMLDCFARRDYRLITPPLVGPIDSLVALGGRDLDLRTFKITDTESGATLGVRADQTPQIADHYLRHRADNKDLRRLCYAGPTLLARPDLPWRGRERFQIGAELFDAPAPGGDWEIAALAVDSLAAAGFRDLQIDFGHAGICAAVLSAAACAQSEEARAELRRALARRDATTLREAAGKDRKTRDLLLALCEAHGERKRIAASAVARHPALRAMIADLLRIGDAVAHTCAAAVSYDLAESGGYDYHNGAVFSVFAGEEEIARGGRYAVAGLRATGFSADLRAACERLPRAAAAAAVVNAPLALADKQWRAAIADLRARKTRLRFCAEAKPPKPRLAKTRGGAWTIER